MKSSTDVVSPSSPRGRRLHKNSLYAADSQGHSKGADLIFRITTQPMRAVNALNAMRVAMTAPAMHQLPQATEVAATLRVSPDMLWAMRASTGMGAPDLQ